MNETIPKFKQYLQYRYPESSTSKHYMSDLRIFSRFVDNVSPQDITPKLSNSRYGLDSQKIHLVKGSFCCKVGARAVCFIGLAGKNQRFLRSKQTIDALLPSRQD